ncbi:MAG: FecR family protein [Acidobacteriota bacterium]
MKSAAVFLSALVSISAMAQQPAIEYRFDEVERKVLLTSGTAETRVTAGQRAHSGDKVETGWFSRTLIASEGHRASFELFSSTEVTLASDTPGVILTLDRGRIRAAFDKIVGSEPRIVKTPGALLAVRGTEFDVRVDGKGETTVDVFEGIVEIRSPLRNEPMFVRAGEQGAFGRERPPSTRPMPEQRQRERAREEEQRHGGGNENRPPGETRPEPHPGRGEGEPSGAPPMRPASPPPPPPHRPPASF